MDKLLADENVLKWDMTMVGKLWNPWMVHFKWVDVMVYEF